jgi:hypothetical protein
MRPEHWLYTIPLRLRSLIRWAQTDQEVDDELRDHLERKTEQYVAQGMTQEEAHRRARLDPGGIEQTKEKCRDARRVNLIQDFLQDFASSRIVWPTPESEMSRQLASNLHWETVQGRLPGFASTQIKRSARQKAA